MIKKLGVAALSAAAILGVLTLSPRETGFTYVGSNDEVTVSASTSLVGLLAAVVIGLCYSIALDASEQGTAGRPASGMRRALAWCLDWLLALLFASSLTALIPLGIEALRTGQFEWSFERHTSTALDWVIGFPLTILTFLVTASYWAVAERMQGQTIGQLLLDLRTVPVPGTRPPIWKSLARGLAITFGPLLWLSRLFADRGRYWHDDLAGVTTNRIEAAPADR